MVTSKHQISTEELGNERQVKHQCVQLKAVISEDGSNIGRDANVEIGGKDQADKDAEEDLTLNPFNLSAAT